MRAWVQDGEITFVASREEVLRWSTAALESVLSHSRAEFYIRTGCSAPNIENLVRLMRDIVNGKVDSFDLDVVAGVGEEENPRRPRPRGQGSTR